MALDLEALKVDIQSHLEQNGFAVFYGYSRLLDSLPIVQWDLERYPDFRKFVEVAKKVSAKLMVFHQRSFTLDHIDDAMDRLQEANFSLEEERSLERKLRELQAYEGFTCALELSFDHEGRVYVFDLRTEWFEALGDILAEIESAASEAEEDDGGPISGYYSKN